MRTALLDEEEEEEETLLLGLVENSKGVGRRVATIDIGLKSVGAEREKDEGRA